MLYHFSYQQAGYQMPGMPSPTATPQNPNPQNVDQNPPQPEQFEEEDDEEFRQRDWLDYVYTFSRFLVLIGIVYFYSSLTRFLMVAVFFLAVYGYVYCY